MNEYGPFVCGCPGAEAGSCSGLCPDGSPLPNPDAAVPDFLFDGVTCGDIDLFAKATSNDTECSGIRQTFSYWCGCTGSNAPSCSGVCANGMPVPNPDLTLGGDTCGDLDFQATLIENEELCSDIQQTYGYLCGCSGSNATLCSGVCANGMPVPHTDLTFGDTTCRDLDFQATFSENEELCSELQQVYGPACGCADMCTVCPGGNVVPEESLSLPLTLVDGTTTTCGDFETSIMNLSSTECSLDKFPIADQCGCPAQNCTLCPNGGQPDFLLSLVSMNHYSLFAPLPVLS